MRSYTKLYFFMKKALFVVFAALMTISATSQVRYNENSLKNYPADINKAKKNLPNISKRSFVESYYLHYGWVDQSMSVDNNASWGQTLLTLNSKYTKANNFSLSDIYQHYGKNGKLYNILGFTSTKAVFSTIDLKKTYVKIDSFAISFEHKRVNNATRDTLIVAIYYDSTITFPNGTSNGNGVPLKLTYNSAPVWADTLSTLTQIATNDTLGTTSPWYFTNKKYKPNLQLLAGKAFGLRVIFKGDTANKINILFSNHDECSKSCVVSESYVPNTAGYQNYVFGATSATPYDFSGCLNQEGMFGCPTGSEACDRWYPQNLQTDMYVTSTTQFNVKIDPINSYLGCSGDSRVLSGSYSGLDTLRKVTMLWKAMGGGTFENGKDTITGGTATYTYDTLGGFKFVILKGTASNGEIAYDTISFTNFSMKPIVTKTGLLSCNIKDSVRLNINGSAAVGISSSIVSYYDPLTTKSLAASQTDLNAYFGIKYAWSSAGNSSRSDTSFIYTKTPGTYTVTVTNFAGCTATNQTIVTGSSTVPTLNFTISPATICQNKPITFTNTSSKITGWNFTWKDGTTVLSTDPNSFTNTFTTAGTKSITLSADTSNCPTLSPAPLSKSITILASTDAKCKSSINNINIENNVSIFPNPTLNGKFTVESKVNSNLDIVITDLLGKVVYTGSVNKLSKKDISLEGAKGVYVITIGNDSEKITKKLMVERD